MPQLKRSKELQYKERDLGNNFKSVTDFLNYFSDKIRRLEKAMNKLNEADLEGRREYRKKIKQSLVQVHKARITTKQFRKFYANKFNLEE